MPACIATSGWKGFDAVRKHSAAHSKLENARPLSSFSETSWRPAAFGAFRVSELVAIAGLLIHEGQKEAHEGLLVGMYVRPSARNAGVARRLVETVIECARDRVELIQLSVANGNEVHSNASQNRRSAASLFRILVSKKLDKPGQLLPRHPQFDHHPLLPFVIDHEMAMEEKAAVFFKMCTRDGLAPRMLGIEGRGPQDDVVAVKRAVALADRHRRLPRVIPHGGEAIRFGIEA
jgi:GNAT superfamily N-acetyltransferase